MNKRCGGSAESIKRHFIKRSQEYDRSSTWVSDKKLIERIRDLADAKTHSTVLDIAIGTGKIAKAFHKKVKYVVGLDICEEMMNTAGSYADMLVLAAAECLPFKDKSFDICVCRQGLQFVELDPAMSEIRRVLKPNGTVVLCHLTAHDKKDKDTAFLIQELRNPARKNFFLPGDFTNLLKRHHFSNIESYEYITRESVNQWIENASITKEAIEKIRRAYIDAPEYFKKIHAIEYKDGDILDSMKMVIVRARAE